MRNHLSEGELRAALDGELDAAQIQHLERCADCQARQRSLQAKHEEIARRLAFLTPADEPAPHARTAWAALSQRLLIKK